jgi:hypothetical protein
MRCKKVLSHLNAYADHELSSSLSREIGNHLHCCRMCQIEFGKIQHVEGFLNTLDVLPVPREFAERVMMEARKRALSGAENKSFFAWCGISLQWLSELSIPVRMAACTTVLLAFFLGMTMSREISLSGNHHAAASREAGMEGFEWFSPVPPESLEHTYMILASSFDVGDIVR